MDAVVTGQVERSNPGNVSYIAVSIGQNVQILDSSDKDTFLVENYTTGQVGHLPSAILSYNDQDVEEEYYTVNSDFVAQDPNQITCLDGDKVKLLKKVNGDWWVIQNNLGAQGEVPAKQLVFYTAPPDTDKKHANTNGRFKRAASKVLLRAPSVKGLKASRSTLKNSTMKLKDHITPKGKKSKVGTDSVPNIPASGEKSSGWGFVKNRLVSKENKRARSTPKSGGTDEAKEERADNSFKVARDVKSSKDVKSARDVKVARDVKSARDVKVAEDVKVARDVKVVNSTPNKPPRRTRTVLDDTKDSPDGLQQEASSTADQDKITEIRSAREGDTTRITPRSDLSFNDSCVWDTFTELHGEFGENKENQPANTRDVTAGNPRDNPHDNTRDNTRDNPRDNTRDNTRVVAMETDTCEIERQSSSDTQNLDSFSEVFASLPEPPEPGTFSPSRRVGVSSASGSGHGMLPSILSPTCAGSTLTVINVTPRCSLEDIVSLSTTESEVPAILNDKELDEILSPPRKSVIRSLEYPPLGPNISPLGPNTSLPFPPPPDQLPAPLDQLPAPLDPDLSAPLEHELSPAPLDPTSDSTPSKKRSCARAPSNMSILSDMSSILSEAPSFSGTKSGIHYFSSAKQEQDDGADTEPDILDTPRMERIIRADPTYNRIVDDSFFNDPLDTGNAANDDVISIRSSEIDDVDAASAARKVVLDPAPVQRPSLGSHPKWDDIARKAKEKMRVKKEDEDRLKKEDEKIKKKTLGKSWFMKNRKEPKDRSGETNFVKRKEIEELADTTMSSTNTLTNTSEIGTPSEQRSRDVTSANKRAVSRDMPPSNGNTDPLPPSRKKRLQRQKTLLDDMRPTAVVSSRRDTDTIDKSDDTDHTTASASLNTELNTELNNELNKELNNELNTELNKELRNEYMSDTLQNVPGLPTVTEAVPILVTTSTEAVPVLLTTSTESIPVHVMSSTPDDVLLEGGRIEFRRSSFDVSSPSKVEDEDIKMRYQRLSASESEIFELLTPTADQLESGAGRDPLTAISNGGDGKEERCEMSTPGSSDTHVTQDTPTNEEEQEEVMGDEDDVSPEEREGSCTGETYLHRPDSLSISTVDDSLDMSANNTLSFVFTQPPKQNAFTVHVTGGHSTLKVSRSPRLTPEKKQGTSSQDVEREDVEREDVEREDVEREDGVFEEEESQEEADDMQIGDDQGHFEDVGGHPGDVGGHHDDRSGYPGDRSDHPGDSDDVENRQDEAVKQDYQTVICSTPPCGRKRKSRDSADPVPYTLLDTIPSPQISPVKFYSPPKMAKHTQSDISPTSRLYPDTLTNRTHPDTQDIRLGTGTSVEGTRAPAIQGTRAPAAIQSQYQELSIPHGPPLVNSVRVLIDSDEDDPREESRDEPGMSGSNKKKIRKQHSVYCDGKENLRVTDSPVLTNRRKGGTSEEHGDVEVDSALAYSEHFSYPRSPGDNPRSPGDNHRSPGDSRQSPGGNPLNAVKVPYHKAYSYPSNQSHNIMSLAVDEPPPSAPPQLHPSAPSVSPHRSLNPDTVLYAEPNNAGIQPPPLPPEYLRRRFGDTEEVTKPQGYHQSDGAYHQGDGAYHQGDGNSPVYQPHLYPTLSKELQAIDNRPPKLSGTSDNDDIQLDRTAPPVPAPQRCSVQTRNVKINTDFHFASYTTDPKSKSWLMKIKKTLGIERSNSKKKIKVNVDRDRPAPSSEPDNPDTSYISQRSDPPPLVQTRAEVTAHAATAPQAPVPTAPQPTPEPPGSVQFEPETKPKQQAPDLYPPLPPPQPTPPPLPPAPHMNPALINQQIFGTHPTVPFPNGGIVPNVPFMWFPFGVPQTPNPGGGGGAPQPVLPSVPQLPQSETHSRISKRKKVPDAKDHDCIDPTLLSHDLIRHVKRSCGLNSSRSRTAARAIIQCLEDSISDTLKIQLLSELLTAIDTPYRARRDEDRTRRKRTRVTEDQDGREVEQPVRKHSCKRALREERILMEYLSQVLEILEEMSEHPDKENSQFHMYFNLANQLLETMYNKVSHKPTYDAS